MGRAKTYDRDTALQQVVGSFHSRGYSATSIRDLIDATEMVPKSLYGEFGGKDDMFVIAIDAYVAEHTKRYHEVLGTQPLGIERIQAYFESLEGLVDSDGCLLVNSLAEVESVPKAGISRVQRFFTWLEGLYRENLLAAEKAGALRPGTDIDGLASAFVTFDQGLSIASRSKTQRANLVRGARALLAAIRT